MRRVDGVRRRTDAVRDLPPGGRRSGRGPRAAPTGAAAAGAASGPRRPLAMTLRRSSRPTCCGGSRPPSPGQPPRWRRSRWTCGCAAPGGAPPGPSPSAPRRGRPGSCTLAENRETLPGRRVRAAGEPAVGDVAVGRGGPRGPGLAGPRGGLRPVVVRRRRRDGRSRPSTTASATTTPSGTARQLVFGDGDGRVFERFTKPVDVLGHEFAHAVTEHTAGLVYRDQPGALNESFSDVFAACLKQRLLGPAGGRGRLADRRRAVRARHPGARPARHGRARHGVRRPGARPGPAGRPLRRLRRHRGRQRRRAPQLRHPQPRLPPRRHRGRRDRRGRAPAASGGPP